MKIEIGYRRHHGRALGGVCCAALLTAVVAVPSQSQEALRRPRCLKDAFPAQKSYSPYAGRNFPTRVFFGDTHVHTGASMDAGAFGARLGPEEAYRFARGEEITAANGMKVKLSRPLDFIVVADHSDNFGFFPKLFAGDPSFLADPTGKRWYELIQKGGADAVSVATEVIDTFSKGTFPPALASLPGTETYRSAWEKDIRAAEKYNEPGRFSAFIGYEWTSNTGGNNLHRVVVFRDGAEKAGQVEPYTTIKPLGSDDPKDLWKVLQAYEDKTGGNVLAIAHNGNLSNGIMFPEIDSFTGKPITREYAADARQVGAHLRSHADEGRRRGASVPFADRRVRRLREVGQVQPQHERAEAGQHAAVRICALGAADRAATRGQARNQSLQVRHDRLDRHAYRPGHGRRRQFLRQARRGPSRTPSAWSTRSAASARTASWAGRSPRPAMPASGRPRTRARRSSTRWSAGKPMPPRARA